MMLTIIQNQMILHADGVTLARTTRRLDSTWDVGTCLVPLSRDQALTALTITELLARGYPDDHPLVTVFRERIEPDLRGTYAVGRRGWRPAAYGVQRSTNPDRLASTTGGVPVWRPFATR